MRREYLAGTKYGIAVLCSLLFPLSLVGQQPSGQTLSPPPDTTISVDVNLVVLHATVRDRGGRYVSNLHEGDFHVFEDGRPQTIRVFQHEDMPVAVGLVVDNSGSMNRKRKDVIAAALTFVNTSNPRDEMFVVNFNEHVSLGLPETKLFSAGPVELEKALNGVPARGMTALYDAIDQGLTHLKQATLDKKVLIVISDGRDNASRHTLAQTLQSVSRSDVIIYTIGLFDEFDEDSNAGVLKKLARASGGETFLLKDTSEVVPTCRRIAEDIRHQYTIGYVPSHEQLDRTYRAIHVTATGPRGQSLLVRTRAGYMASAAHEGPLATTQGKPQ